MLSKLNMATGLTHIGKIVITVTIALNAKRRQCMKVMNGPNKEYTPSAPTVVHVCLSQRTKEEKANISTLTLDEVINIDWETIRIFGLHSPIIEW